MLFIPSILFALFVLFVLTFYFQRLLLFLLVLCTFPCHQGFRKADVNALKALNARDNRPQFVVFNANLKGEINDEREVLRRS